MSEKKDFGLCDVVLCDGALVQYLGFDYKKAVVCNEKGEELLVDSSSIQRKATNTEVEWFAESAVYGGSFTNEDWLNGLSSVF